MKSVEKIIPDYKLGSWLSKYDTIFDAITFEQLIDAVHCNCEVKDEAAVRREAQQILSGRLQDFWYLIDHNMGEIIDAATPEAEKPLVNHPDWSSERLEALAFDIYHWLKKQSLWQDVYIYYDGKCMGTSGTVDGKTVYRYNGEPFIEDGFDPRKYFDYVAKEHILSLSFEGPLYDVLNGCCPGWPKLEAEFRRIFQKHGCYMEMGDAWNGSCYV